MEYSITTSAPHLPQLMRERNIQASIAAFSGDEEPLRHLLLPRISPQTSTPHRGSGHRGATLQVAAPETVRTAAAASTMTWHLLTARLPRAGLYLLRSPQQIYFYTPY
jgi:hypothetical protein